MDSRQFLASSLALAASPSYAASANWEQAVCNLLNAARARANQQELAKYGSYQISERLPLIVNPQLTAASEWWSNAVKGTGIQDHFAPTNAAGYLIRSFVDQTVVSRVRLPTEAVPGGYQTYWHLLVLAMGLNPLHGNDNQNLLFAGDMSAFFVANAWINSGYNADPRLAGGHYWNVIMPLWTHCGIANGPWLGGRKSAVCDFAQLV